MWFCIALTSTLPIAKTLYWSFCKTVTFYPSGQLTKLGSARVLEEHLLMRECLPPFHTWGGGMSGYRLHFSEDYPFTPLMTGIPRGRE